MRFRFDVFTRVALLVAALWLSPGQAQQFTETSGAKEVALAADRFQRGAPVPGWVERITTIPASDLKGPIVHLLFDTQLLVADEPASHVHKAVVANTPLSLEDVARFSIQFNPAYQRVDFHTLRVHRGGQPLDRMSSSKVTFLQREVGLNDAIYTGNITASVIIADLRVGDVLEFEYTTYGHNPVLGKRFVHEVSWYQPWVTELRRVSLWMPPERQVNWRFEGGEVAADAPVEDSRVGPYRRLRWVGAKLPQTEVDANVPAGFTPLRYIRFSEFRDWRDVAAWADQLFAPAREQSPEIKQLISKLMEKPSPDERASAALAWVQSEIRYVSMSLGESSHRPAPAALTLERRFGDCKDKSALLVQLLRGMGLKADPVLISASEVRGIANHLPSPHSFDHAIVRAEVDGNIHYLDPTRLGQFGALSKMGQTWDGAEVLVVRADTRELARITTDKAALTADVLEERLRIPKFGGPGELSIRRSWTGVQAEAVRVLFAQISNDKLQKHLLEPYEKRFSSYELTKAVRVEDNRQINQITAVMEMRIPAPAANSPERWTVIYEASNLRGVLQLPESRVRRQPLAMPFKTVYMYTMEVEFPSTVNAANDPNHRDYRAPGFVVNRATTFRDNRATVRLVVGILEPEVEPKQIATYANAVRWLRSVERDEFTVAKTAPMAPGASLATLFETRLASRLDRVTKSLEPGRLSGEDLANAYCERARVLSYKGQLEKALADIDLAVRASPDSPTIQTCRGNVLARADESREAVAAFNSAIVLDPGNGDANFFRGLARFHEGQMALAVTDFAATIRIGMRNKYYPQLWHTFASRRLGQEPDAKIKALVTGNPKGEWPLPAIALMCNLIGPDDVLAIVSAKSGEDRELTLTEAYHAIAQWHYARGEKTQAAEYFSKTMAQGAVSYIEHDSARKELKSLGASR